MLIVLLVVVGGLSVLPSVPRTAPSPATSLATPAVLPPTHGDLVVGPGQTFVIQPTPGTHTYYQGGNITVDAGGTLIVRNVTLSFVQFVSDSGTPMQRLSHIYRFVDLGKVNLYNSTVTTDVQVINAWAKLNLTVEGAMTAWNSTFAFPGWITVEGTSGDLTLNASAITANPAVAGLSEPTAILGDTSFAASLAVTGGAQLNAFASTINDTYANSDNLLSDSPAQPLPLNTGPALFTSGDYDFTQLLTSNTSASLTQDWLYPLANFTSGYVYVTWVNANNTNGQATLEVVYDGVAYPLTTLTFAANSAGTFSVPLPADLLQAVTNDGVLNYLNWTGDFGVGPSRIAIDFLTYTGPGVGLINAYLSLFPSPQYNIAVSGTGSTLNSADSSFGLNWNAVPASSTSQLAPLPWNSNKLILTNGAKAYLANATISSPIPGVFSTSAVIVDNTSEAYFYRWAQFNLTGRGGYLPIANAHVDAYYAYTTSESDNQTANALNDLATANPQIWGYVQFWDAEHGIPSYGTSDIAGIALLLLASTNITLGTLPDGYFLGGYHIGIYVPAPGVGNRWFNWTVSPYPTGVAQPPNEHAGPDYAPAQRFSTYFGLAGIASVTVSANGVTSTTLNLGQTLGVKVVVEDLGTVPISQVSGALYYNDSGLPSALLATYNVTDLQLTLPGQETNFTLDWKATENVTHLNAVFAHNFSLVVDWNYNTVLRGGGNLSRNVSVTFLETLVTVASATLLANGAPNATVELGQTLGVQLVVDDVGNATISSLYALLYYNSTKVLASFSDESLHLSTPGQATTFDLTWKATENVTGLQGWFQHNISFELSWNNISRNLWLGSGNLDQNVSVRFAPSQIAFRSFQPPPSTLDLGTTYYSIGNVAYNGSHPASIVLIATPVGGGVPVIIAGTSTLPGNFSMPWSSLSGVLTAGTTYTLTARATYNSRSTNYTLPGTYAVPPAPSSATSFLNQKFLGLPLWVWLAIAAAAVVAIVLFLFFARRQAAGKLVECGECGNLIPEDATVCPKCGAEFESDLIRCSRCASTIPADSKFCPECAAQLLGTPGEAAADPEKQAYADFTEKYRAEAKRELGDNYSEGAFWDWWKRQPSYTPFSQWSLQQGQGTARAGMTAPPARTETTPEADAGRMPPKGGAAAAAEAPRAAPSAAPPPPSSGAGTATVPPPAAGGANLKACPNCGKEIPSEYLVCPFCNAVTQ